MKKPTHHSIRGISSMVLVAMLAVSGCLLSGCRLWGQTCYTEVKTGDLGITFAQVSDELSLDVDEVKMDHNGIQYSVNFGNDSFFFDENGDKVEEQILIIKEQRIPSVHPTALWSGNMKITPGEAEKSDGEKEVDYKLSVDLTSDLGFIVMNGVFNALVQPQECYFDD